MDFGFFMPVQTPVHRPTDRYLEFEKVLPYILREYEDHQIIATEIWKEYKLIYPEGYTQTVFKDLLIQYCLDHHINRQERVYFPEEEQIILTEWRNGNDHRRWQIAVALQDAAEYIPIDKTQAKIEVCRETLLRWYKTYKKYGLDGFKRKCCVGEAKKSAIKTKTDNLVDLLHQSPHIYHINRTSWRLEDLATIYKQVYHVSMGTHMISRYLRQRGYRYISSKTKLTSPDPLYKEKFQVIQDILANLGTKEKFFSIDEYGPFAIKMKGGRKLMKQGTRKIIPQTQKSKGYIICTAAIELSTNQVTHFYSPNKNTDEMIKLIDKLLIQYMDQDTIYLSWDAASWHTSKQLVEYIDILNSEAFQKLQRLPKIVLATLPCRAQFLNVIESVFSGLARAVIHNSDYPSVKACRQAIDLYFQSRNTYYQMNPKKAGKKIWGKELVAPVFDKANQCKPSYQS